MNKFDQPVNWSTLMISNCRKHFQSWKVFYNQFVGIVQSCYLQIENIQKCLRWVLLLFPPKRKEIIDILKLEIELWEENVLQTGQVCSYHKREIKNFGNFLASDGL